MVPEEILLVNDGSLLLQMMGGLLENKGHQVSLTDSPDEALVHLSSRNLTLVVVKLDGRQLDRLAVMHMVKELNAGTRLVVVGEQAPLPAEVFEVEADDYVILPCRLAKVWRRLILCLESPAREPGVFREDGPLHPVNQRLLHNLGLMFHDLRGLLTSIHEGMRFLERRVHSTCGPEAAEVCRETCQKTRTLLQVSEAFLQRFNNGKHRPAAGGTEYPGGAGRV